MTAKCACGREVSGSAGPVPVSTVRPPMVIGDGDLARLLRGQLHMRGQARTQADMLIAATAAVHGLVLVTRNERDFEACGAAVLHPFR